MESRYWKIWVKPRSRKNLSSLTSIENIHMLKMPMVEENSDLVFAAIMDIWQENWDKQDRKYPPKGGEFISEVIMDDIILFVHILVNLVHYLVYKVKGV